MQGSLGCDLEPDGGQPPVVPAVAGSRPEGGVRGRRSQGPAAAHALHSSPVVDGRGRVGYPRQGRPHSLLGPLKLIGRRADVCSTATMVQVFLYGYLVKSYVALEQKTNRQD